MEEKKSVVRWYKKWWVWILTVPVVFIGLLVIFVEIFCLLPVPENISEEMAAQIKSSCSGDYSGNINKPINTLPMYGGIEKTEEQRRADENFVNAIISETGSRESGSVVVADGARKFFEQGNLDMAMKRYNQAWLLDSNNPDVYVGFGDILKKQGKEAEAADMYKKAEELKR